MLNPQPLPPREFGMLNPQPLPPRVSGASAPMLQAQFQNPGSLASFNPQPDPPVLRSAESAANSIGFQCIVGPGDLLKNRPMVDFPMVFLQQGTGL